MVKKVKKAAKKVAPKKAAKKSAKKVSTKKPAIKLGDPADTFASIASNVNAMQDDMDAFKSGNKSAGRRLRKSVQEVRNLCGLIRKEIQNDINNM